MIVNRYRVNWAAHGTRECTLVDPHERYADWHTSYGFFNAVMGAAWRGLGKLLYEGPVPPPSANYQMDDCVNGMWSGRVIGYPFTITDLDLVEPVPGVLGSEPPVSQGP